MLHDGYLKLFQPRNPVLHRYSHILFDEAQDANPVTAAIVGAKNAMQGLDGERFELTQSWRFGSSVALIANQVLAEKGEKSMVIGMNGQGEIGPIDTTRPFMTICRTNAGIFDYAVASVQDGELIHFLGGVENYKFNRIEDSWNLKRGDIPAIRDWDIRNFGTFEEMKRCAEESNDLDLKGLIRAVETYGDAIPELIRQVKACASDADHSTQTLVTGHRCKGLEADQVRLADDFMDLLDYAGMRNDPKQDREQLECEINLIYVAATRALRRLQINPKLQVFLSCLSPT